jgi:hypothetical protein
LILGELDAVPTNMARVSECELWIRSSALEIERVMETASWLTSNVRTGSMVGLAAILDFCMGSNEVNVDTEIAAIVVPELYRGAFRFPTCL